ncbi:GntR family transcriptional regulator [Rhodococcus sp. BP-349]|uniref:GntR family transcriptional regulator n=1 Tax=unclassified Rhodococcus (in: high G+C Gram-positive bacteria) TaxID=192944 RepID=UPI001C9AB703|nr:MULTISPECIES: GntR family transcriptional regulator [unclassified Rhodococcus (in: high G+C Gram-positive bacteria)]MBY6539808.1 GntR family transcriptional regulator [Rhodococcus sp. BP-363]MBY6543864.1 GntR family transcriptional regulator [Rhodococcus sp. BP-369]MBY6563094.1 GntR family transcriptional regulator [Rhodococcus sp. BP-370]MBY6577386.1 GntR family transcriptional regulator [Rhodococcus sp. BP-364]MBY6586687.1 GntR family transcriptional regulator [Rhodococcus sp. BP-358]
MPPRRRSALLATLSRDVAGGSQEEILTELRRVILSGDAPPGTPIPPGDVADVFGVSRIPVRESLKTLIGENLVSHRPNLGYTVAQLTSQELREMYIVREVLENAALAVAAEAATDGERRRAEQIERDLRSSIADDDPRRYHRLSREFHVALTAPSRMYRLLHMLDVAWNVTESVQPMVHVKGADRAALNDDHSVMVRAFVDRDSAALLAAAGHHTERLNDVIATLPAGSGLLS